MKAKMGIFKAVFGNFHSLVKTFFVSQKKMAKHIPVLTNALEEAKKHTVTNKEKTIILSQYLTAFSFLTYLSLSPIPL
jgi:hypothetical protein